MQMELSFDLTASAVNTLFKKSGVFFARWADDNEYVVTEINGEVETTKFAVAGEVVVRGPAGELYVVPQVKFYQRYDTEDHDLSDEFQPFKAKGMVRAVEHKGAPFEFVASWGEKMICNTGDYLANPVLNEHDFNVTEVYRIERSVFDQTYTRFKL